MKVKVYGACIAASQDANLLEHCAMYEKLREENKKVKAAILYKNICDNIRISMKTNFLIAFSSDGSTVFIAVFPHPSSNDDYYDLTKDERGHQYIEVEVV